jgi:branched-chain amino acid aminotransferase
MDRHPGAVWLDGRVLPAGVAHLPVTDRGFQLGDGLFETLRARRGVPIEWDEHLARLREGAAALSIPLPAGDVLARGIRELLDAEDLAGPGDARRAPGDAAVRITVSRGSLEHRGTLPPGWDHVAPTVVIQCWAYAPPPDRLLEAGVRATTSSVRRDPGSPLAGIKATSRADYVYAKLEAERAGVDDALFLTLDRRISEATSANVFAIFGDELRTPTVAAAILAGTTRTWLLTDPAVRASGLRPTERDVRPADLVSADEAFLSSSVAGIVPLVELDGRPIGSGAPGERTAELRIAREAAIEAASRSGSDLDETPSRRTRG